jgi:hypothetical protein
MSVPATPDSVRPHGSTRSRGLAVAGVVGLALLLAGCAGSSAGTASESSIAVAGSAVPGPRTAPGSGAASDGTASGAVAQTDTTGTAAYAVAPAALATDRSVVVKADVGVRVDDVLRSASALGALAVKHAATIASQSTSAGSTTQPDVPTNPDGTPACPSTGCPTTYASSTTTLRLGNKDVDSLLADVAKLGTVETATRTSDDVTADVADVAARVLNAQASVARVRALMSQATRIGDVVALEGELSKRQADLEALEARQRTFADQAAQATVTVRLYGSSAPVVTTTEKATGFLAGLRAGWDSFTGVMAAALTVLGALVPWLLVLGPVALVLGLVLRRRRESPNLVDQVG